MPKKVYKRYSIEDLVRIELDEIHMNIAELWNAGYKREAINLTRKLFKLLRSYGGRGPAKNFNKMG